MYIVQTGLTWVILSWITEDIAITTMLERQQKAAQHLSSPLCRKQAMGRALFNLDPHSNRYFWNPSGR